MATAGDPGREARDDLTRVDPLHDLTEAGVAGDPTRSPQDGTAEVHSRITGGGSYDDAGQLGGERDHSTAERAKHAYEEVRQGAIDWGERASDFAARARRGMDDTLQTVEDRVDLEGVTRVIRQNPLLAVGLAFGAGMLLAGSMTERRTGLKGAATGQLRGALVGGLTAALSQELRELVDGYGGAGGLLSSLMASGEESD